MTWGHVLIFVIIGSAYVATFVPALIEGRLGLWAVCFIGLPVGGYLLGATIVWLSNKPVRRRK